MKFCVNCTHFDAKRYQCARPKEGSLSLVTGKPLNILPFDAAFERENAVQHGITLCGPEGRFWEKKE